MIYLFFFPLLLRNLKTSTVGIQKNNVSDIVAKTSREPDIKYLETKLLIIKITKIDIVIL